MPRWEDRFRTNSLNQLNNARQENYNLRNGIVEEEIIQSENCVSERSVSIDFPHYPEYPTFAYETLISNLTNAPTVVLGKPKKKYKYIKPYNYVPDKFYFNCLKNNTDNLYLGVELEIDKGGKNDDVAKFIKDFLGKHSCYIKHDGSLENGMEIVTHPSTLDFHKSLSYKSLFEDLSKKGYKSHDTVTCGYHIHVNRNFFGENPTTQDLNITKILYLLEKHWDKVKIIARRDSNGYSKRFHMKENDSMFDLLVKAKGEYSSKYNMINLQHPNTIEFRMFKGTLKYETFIATMEFVHNLVHLCKEIQLEDIQNIDFKDILDIKPTEYLNTYIQERIKK